MTYNYENLTLDEIFVFEHEECFLHSDLFKKNKNLSINYLVSKLDYDDIIYVAYNKYCPKEFIEKYYSLEMLEQLFLNELEYDYEKPYGPYHDLNPLLHLKINLNIVDKFYFINKLDTNHEIFKKNNMIHWNFEKLSYNENLNSEFIKKYPKENWNKNRIIFLKEKN
jgi:hypothetical protein